MSHFKQPLRANASGAIAFSTLLAEWGMAISEDTTVHEHASYLLCQDPNHPYTYADLMEFRIEHIVKRAKCKYPTRSHDITLLNIIHQMLKPEVLKTLVDNEAYTVPSPLQGRYFIDED
jgi:hypothetical protein